MPELWIASERELVGSGSGWKDVFPSLRHPQRSQARKRQHSKLDQRSSYVLECFRHAGALDRARAGTRCKWERLGGRVPEPMSSIAVASASTPNLADGAAMFWSASSLPELWIAPERELVGSGSG